MARTKRSAKLDTWTARKKLKTGQYHQERLGHGQYIAYRKPKNGGTGTWTARWWNEEDNRTLQSRLGFADDIQDADGNQILSYPQAHQIALLWFRTIQRQTNIELDGSTVPKGSFKIKDAMEAYFKDGELRGMKSVDHVRKLSRAWILPTLGHLEVSRLTRMRLEAWRDEISQSSRKKATKLGLPPRYFPPPATDDEKRCRKVLANRVLALLKASLNHCSDRGHFDVIDKCWQPVKAFKGVGKPRTKFLTLDEQYRLVNACPPEFKELVKAALFTGCRFGELQRLQCKDYDPDNGTIYVAISKTGKPRHIFLTEEAKAFFAEITKDRDPESIMLYQTRNTRKNGRIKTQWDMNHKMILLNKALEKANIGKITFHELRHTYASTLVNRGCSLFVVAHQLGHATTKMVEQVYGHLAPSTVRDEVMRTMPNLGIQ